MIRIGKKQVQFIVAGAVLAAVAMVAVGCIQVGITSALDNYLFFAAVTVIAPLVIIQYTKYQWQKRIDKQLPELFTNIVQFSEVGMTLPQALDEASKRDYGPLTPELKRMTVQMSWGYSFEQALESFGKRVGTRLMQRLLPLMLEAFHSGGRMGKVFDPMGKFIQTNNMLEKERRAQTRPYILIMYIALAVFLFTIILLFKTFFAAAQGVPLMTDQATAPEDMQRIFMHMTLIQGFFSGIVAGKMGEGSAPAGLKHSLILMLIGYITLKLFMW